jgi:hypothetical protein
MEVIVRNEAKPGQDGIYGQGQLSCRAWLGPGVKRAKRTQFGPAVGGCRGKNLQNKANL